MEKWQVEYNTNSFEKKRKISHSQGAIKKDISKFLYPKSKWLVILYPEPTRVVIEW